MSASMIATRVLHGHLASKSNTEFLGGPIKDCYGGTRKANEVVAIAASTNNTAFATALTASSPYLHQSSDNGTHYNHQPSGSPRGRGYGRGGGRGRCRTSGEQGRNSNTLQPTYGRGAPTYQSWESTRSPWATLITINGHICLAHTRPTRLVCEGRSQKEGIDCGETFSPIVKPATIRTIVSITLSNAWEVHQLDVKFAFLHAYFHETVYMHQPPNFRDQHFPNHVCLLKTSLYSLKHTPRAWYQHFEDYVFTLVFKHNKYDYPWFVYKNGKQMAFLLLYVDDILLITSSQTLRQDFMFLLAKDFS
ncbi:hypothetical protein OSB04_024151 [Centaurea solstitialis]|uniref:Reverse transcriptase Ty1/copia-type domain-containing protein n=1 Tax=Centaurea solstitialis TaxID=347529 RepID=A0AA38WBS8_9ASTR|nr:hypothetical protein OSB04_024151 [Centaurea solstitialis]